MKQPEQYGASYAETEETAPVHCRSCGIEIPPNTGGFCSAVYAALCAKRQAARVAEPASGIRARDTEPAPAPEQWPPDGWHETSPRLPGVRGANHPSGASIALIKGENAWRWWRTRDAKCPTERAVSTVAEAVALALSPEPEPLVLAANPIAPLNDSGVTIEPCAHSYALGESACKLCGYEPAPHDPAPGRLVPRKAPNNLALDALEQRQAAIDAMAPMTDAEIDYLLTTTLHGPLPEATVTRALMTLAELPRARARVAELLDQLQPADRLELELRRKLAAEHADELARVSRAFATHEQALEQQVADLSRQLETARADVELLRADREKLIALRDALDGVLLVARMADDSLHFHDVSDAAFKELLAVHDATKDIKP